MASSNDFEPMDQDVDDTLQVQVTNDIFKSNDDELDFEADDLEVTEFTRASTRDAELRSSKESVKDNSEKVDAASPSEGITISITKSDDVDNAKEDGEISEGQSQSDASDIDDNNGVQYFSRSSSMRSSRRKNDIRRERSPVARQYPNPYLEFDDAKIQSRALRFGLPNANAAAASSNTLEEVSSHPSDEERLSLYLDCGLIYDDGGNPTLEKVSSQFRLDSILIRGTNHMNTNEIFKYLYDMGQKPVSMEWVNDAMCVVIYSDRFDAAAAMMKMSKRILMDPLIVERKRSIVQSSEVDKDTEDNSEEKADNNMNEDIDYDKADEIPQSWITVPMPPGYVWRLGAPCDKAKGILVRFATKNDKKQERAERFSEYYKNYGNPNKARNGRENSGPGPDNMGRRRKKLRQEFLSSQEADRKEGYASRESQLKMTNPNDKNGWGQLSAMWDDEEAFQKSARDRFFSARQRSRESESGAGISPLKRTSSLKESPSPKSQPDARDILKSRQKRKRGRNSSDDEGGSDSDEYGDNNRFDVADWKESGSYRRKRGSRVDDDDGDKIAWRERLTAPRMRMHADEEEERMKRRAFRRLGQKRGSGGEGGLQTNSWDFSRESSNNSSFRSKSGARRPISERLGAKRHIPPSNPVADDNDDLTDEHNEFPKTSGFDLRQKLINMRRAGNEEGEEEDEEEDLHDLIFYGND